MPHFPNALPQTQHLSRTGLSLAPRGQRHLQRVGTLILALACTLLGYTLGRSGSGLLPERMQSTWVGQPPYAVPSVHTGGLMRLPIDEVGRTLQYARAPGGEFAQQLEGWRLRLRQVQQGAQFDASWQRPVLVSAKRDDVIKE